MNQVPDSCLAAHDNARSLVAASSEMGMPAATARHIVWTRRWPSALVSPHTVAVIGGDNQAESQFPAVTRLMRKQN